MRYETLEQLDRAYCRPRNICSRYITIAEYREMRDRILFREKAERMEARRLAEGWTR